MCLRSLNRDDLPISDLAAKQSLKLRLVVGLFTGPHDSLDVAVEIARPKHVSIKADRADVTAVALHVEERLGRTISVRYRTTVHAPTIHPDGTLIDGAIVGGRRSVAGPAPDREGTDEYYTPHQRLRHLRQRKVPLSAQRLGGLDSRRVDRAEDP